MKSEIIAFACGAKCGAFERRSSGKFSPGLLDGAASSRSPCSRWASAKAPIPNADCAKNSRRERGAQHAAEWVSGAGPKASIDMQKLVGAEKLLTETGERRRLVIRFLADRSQVIHLLCDKLTG